MTRPRRLAPNLVDHFYEGGARIAALRGIETTSPRQPEEWLAATVERAGEPGVGLARDDDGALLRDVVAGDPVAWRGVGPWPGLADSDTGLLVKLLDAGQRLPVHVHPDRPFAQSHLGCPYGKTEAWFVLDADPGAVVHLGWREDVDPEELAARRDAQDGAWMLERMHEIAVRPGEGILVPSGQVHAIGAGVFVMEVQEPTDLSILLEWSVTTATREESHLGLGFERVMGAVSHRALDAAELDALVHRLPDPAPGRERCLPAVADRWFRLDRLVSHGEVNVVIDAGGAVLLVTEGAPTATGADGSTLELAEGEVWAVPHAFGPWTLGGDGVALLARPGDRWPHDLAPGTGGER